MDCELLKKLEFDKVLDIMSAFTVSEIAKTDVFDLIVPQKNKANAERLLTETEEAYSIYYSENLKALTSFDDASEAISKSGIFALLTLSEIRRVMFLLRAGRIAKSVISNSRAGRLLRGYICLYSGDAGLEKDIGAAIISDTEVSDNASAALREIRKKLTAARVSLANSVKKYSRSSDVSKYLQDDLVTLREGRYVLPVKAEYRSFVPGLVHDCSQTGATLFVEPFNIVDSNNEIRSLQIEEQQEIERIIKELVKRIAAVADDLSEMQKALKNLDVIFAKAHFAAEFRCFRPTLNENGRIILKESRHPLIDPKKVVPVSVSMGSEKADGGISRILMITGPNTGGKTVVLKTIGLFCLMASAGIFIPAREGSETAVFENIFADIGDRQSVVSSLSTFSSHVQNIVSILDNVTKNSLVLFDELGSGTDPEEGAALALGVIKYLELVGACVVVTTHYGQLKQYAMTRSNIQNASMQFDNKSLRPTYRLIDGLPGSSNALKIAGTLGVNDYVISEALKSLPQSKVQMEKLIGQAEELKNSSISELEQLRREQANVEKLKAELNADRVKLKERLQKIQESARAEIRLLVSNSADTAAELIEQIKQQLKISDEKALLEAKRLMKKIENIRFEVEYGDEAAAGNAFKESIKPIDESLLREGMDIFIISLSISGRILKLNHARKEASVHAGAAVANIKFDNLASLDLIASLSPVKKRKSGSAEIKKTGEKTTETVFIREINVMGQTVAEAIEAIDSMLVGLNEAGEKKLKIVHGKGTGALGRGIHAYLKNIKEIKSFRYGGYGEGDTGVTIVEFKD